VLLKWLGEVGAASAIRAAATISVPYDLAAASRYLERPGARFYTYHFLRRLKPKALDVLTRFPRETAHLDAARIQAARTFAEFDQAVTAPMHGFTSAEDYYARASSLGYLSRIAVPTLCISSEDDPFCPAESIPHARAAASSSVTFEVTPWGGHTGFVSGAWPWRPRYWAEELTVDWLGRIGEPTVRAVG
jgi:predicted alpha/beta-fold hydrolase